MFGAVQLSVSPWDQRALKERGIGVLAKRSLANAPWRPLPDDAGPDRREYRRRHEALAFTGLPTLDGDALDWPSLAIRFAAHASGVDAALLGTARVPHLESAAAAVRRGPLDATLREALHTRFDAVGATWPGIV